jgi:hypothetical protein
MRNDGTGIGWWTAEEERKDYERIIKNWRPRGTHSLGAMYGSKHGEKIIDGAGKEKEKGNSAN